jgi:hypothetical protein
MRLVAACTAGIAAFASGCGPPTGCVEDEVDTATDEASDGIDDEPDGLPPDGPPPCGECDDGDPCTVDSCNEATGECVHGPLDVDGDGHAAERAPDGTPCGDDCDDLRPDVHPGAPDVCGDDVDADCDGEPEGFAALRETRLSLDDSRRSQDPDIAWSGSVLGVSWTDVRDGNEEIYFTLVDGEGREIGEEVRITEHWGASVAASVAWTGSTFGIAWHEYRTGADPVTGFSLVDADGVEIGDEILVEAPAWGNLAWTGAGWGSATLARDDMDHSRSILLSVLGPSGGIEAVTEFVRVTSSETWTSLSAPVMVWTGSGFGVAWGECRDMPHGYNDDRIVLALAGDDGTMTGDPIQLLRDGSGTVDSGRPGLAWTGSAYAVAWGGSVLSFASIGPGDEMGVSSVIGGEHDDHNDAAEIRWTGSEFGVLWRSRNYGSDHVLWLARVDAGGLPIDDPIQVSDSLGYHGHSIEWMGSAYGVSWGDVRDDPESEIYFRLVGPCY